MRRTAAVGSFLAIVTGCGNPAPADAPRTPASTTVARPTPQERFSARAEWMSGSRGDRGGLDFAIPETDAVGISMECNRGSGVVRVSTADRLSAGIRLVNGSGASQTEVAASPIHDSVIDDGIYAVANVPVDDETLRALRMTGEMWVWDDSQFMRAETDAERQAIEDFFLFCGAS